MSDPVPGLPVVVGFVPGFVAGVVVPGFVPLPVVAFVSVAPFAPVVALVPVVVAVPGLLPPTETCEVVLDNLEVVVLPALPVGLSVILDFDKSFFRPGLGLEIFDLEVCFFKVGLSVLDGSFFNTGFS